MRELVLVCRFFFFLRFFLSWPSSIGTLLYPSTLDLRRRHLATTRTTTVKRKRVPPPIAAAIHNGTWRVPSSAGASDWQVHASGPSSATLSTCRSEKPSLH